jgi:hypothetical protein
VNHAMFSPEALAHFKQFALTAQKDRATRRASPLSNPQGAFDVSTTELKRAIARDAAPGETQMDPQTLNLILECLRETFGDEAHGALTEALDKAYPGCVNAAHPESPDTATSEDEADRDWPPANANGQPGEMQAEDEEFSPAGQFAAMGHDMPKPFPGMPVPGGKMVAQDRALKRAQRLRLQYQNEFPFTRRFGDSLSYIPTKPHKMTAQDAALQMAGTEDFYAMFPQARRIGIV